MVPQSKYEIKCPYLMDWEYITIHNTYNRASAMAEASYMTGHDMYISWHYAVDDIRAVQCLPLNRNGWHAGDGRYGTGNRKSIGIEICYSLDKGDPRYPIAEYNAAILCAMLLKSKNFGVDRIKIHRDWSGKYCPHRMLDNGHWPTVFKAKVQKELDALGGTEAKPAPALKPTGTTGRIKVNDRYKVKVVDLNLYKEAWSTSAVVGKLANNSEHVISEKWGNWGRLASGQGWFYLGSAEKVTTPTIAPTKTRVKTNDLYKINTGSLNVHKEAWSTSKVVGRITDEGIYTIVEQWGNWGRLKSGMGWIHLEFTKKIGAAPNTFNPYIVRVRINNLYFRAGAGTNYSDYGFIAAGAYTVLEESTGQGANKWGKIKDKNGRIGWIALDFAEKI